MLIPWEKIHTHTHTQNYAHLDSILLSSYLYFAFGSDGKASVYNVGDPVWSLGWEVSLEKEMAIHSRTIAWKIPWIEEPGRLQSIGSQRVGHDWANSLITFAQFTHVIACISTSVLFNGETLFLWHSIFPFFIHQLIDIWVVSTL